MTQQTIDKLRDALDELDPVLANEHGCYFIDEKTATTIRDALKFIETDEAGKRLLQLIEQSGMSDCMIEGGE
jgi:hypothetical protein